MEYRTYNTGDQVWLDDQEVIRVHTNDGLFWAKGQRALTKTNGLYHVSSNGDKVWFGTRYGQRVVTKFVSADGLVWSEEEPEGHSLSGVELAVHRAEVFLTKIILKVLSA